MTNIPAIFFDNHATTKLDPSILEFLTDNVFSLPLNASAIQTSHGEFARAIFEESRNSVAEYFRVTSKQLVFTSGATEGLNQVIQSVVSSQKVPTKIISLSVEHPAVFDTLNHLQSIGKCTVEILEVDAKGRLILEGLEERIVGADLAICMAANNEIGNIYPISRLAKVCRKNNVNLLCDATQAIGKVPMSAFKEVDFLVLSGHKIHALQGVGLIVDKSEKIKLQPILFGGGQQSGLRPGTINLPGVVSMSKALNLLNLQTEEDLKSIELKRDRLIELLSNGIPEFSLTGDVENKLINNLHFCLPGLLNTVIIERLRGTVSLSTGSACSSGTVQHSKVLQAMRLPYDYQESAIRIGLSKFTTDEEIQKGAEAVIEAANFCREF